MRTLVILISLASSVELYSQTMGYLPLEVGNTWYFHSNAYDPAIMQVIADTTMSGKFYKAIFNRAMADYPQTIYLRQDSNKVYLYNEYNGLDQLIYDFASAAGDTFMRGPGTLYGMCFENKLVQYAGGTRRQWGFISGASCCIDGARDAKLVDSIGWRECGGSNYGATLTRAIIRGKEIVTGVPSTQEFMPSTFDVAVYPNPFNSEAILEYTVPHAGAVQISLVNVLGQSVRIDIVQVPSGGKHKWSISVSGLASGLYFCRVAFGDLVAVKKALLLK